MSNEKDGGPAFPRPASKGPGVVGGYVDAQTGMSLRDYFAAMAMQAMVRQTFLTDTPTKNCIDACRKHMTTEEWVSRTAYSVADHMLNARK